MTETRKPSPTHIFRRVAVLGAGTMGAQIAAHFANAGLRVELLDIPGKGTNRNDIVEGAFKRMTSLKPNPLYSTAAASRIRLGNFDDHLDRLGEVDWVVEAVVERLDIKAALFERVEAVISDHTIVSTNTSGIPVGKIASERSSAFQKRFLGTHFFNPPRYLKLCEVISGEKTDASVIESVSEFVRVHLGKGVVLAKDSPYFIGNRIGIFAMLLALKERSTFGFSMEEVDQLTGTLVGHPKSATFRTADVVGLDVMKAVISNLYESVPEDESRDVFTVPSELNTLVESGQLGAKTKAGYYKKVGKDILSHNVEPGDYQPAGKLRLKKFSKIAKEKDLKTRLRLLFESKSPIGDSFRRTTLGTLAYAARRIPEVSDSPEQVDNAIKWGFGWEMGPFEIWDAMGKDRVIESMKSLSIALPDWIQEMTSDSFYTSDSVYSPVSRTSLRRHVHEDESVFTPPFDVLHESEHTMLARVAGDVAVLEFKSKANTLGNGVVADIVRSVRTVENSASLKGLVIANRGSNFSVGANLVEVGLALLARRMSMIEGAVQQFQMAMEVVRSSTKPVVVMGHSRVLGGATELMLSSRTPMAVAETYMGLVELGVGLIPAGTGCLRLMEQAAAKSANGFPSEIQAHLGKSFQQVATAAVSTSAGHAKQMGYLPQHATVVMREERRFAVAIAEVKRLSEQGYLPESDPETVHVLGAPARAAFESMAFQMHQGKFISDYDLELANKLAYVMTGGDLPGDGHVPRSYILKLEREVFMELLTQKKTKARIRHLLQKRTILRN